jgi:hypothetical protein
MVTQHPNECTPARIFHHHDRVTRIGTYQHRRATTKVYQLAPKLIYVATQRVNVLSIQFFAPFAKIHKVEHDYGSTVVLPQKLQQIVDVGVNRHYCLRALELIR